MKIARVKTKFFKGILKCIAVKTIQDVNDQYPYKDEIPRGPGDGNEVSCGQDKESGHNELQYIYDTHLKDYVDEGEFTYVDAVKALCEVCNEMGNPRKRSEFYKKLGEKLEIVKI